MPRTGTYWAEFHSTYWQVAPVSCVRSPSFGGRRQQGSDWSRAGLSNRLRLTGCDGSLGRADDICDALAAREVRIRRVADRRGSGQLVQAVEA